MYLCTFFCQYTSNILKFLSQWKISLSIFWWGFVQWTLHFALTKKQHMYSNNKLTGESPAKCTHTKNSRNGVLLTILMFIRLFRWCPRQLMFYLRLMCCVKLWWNHCWFRPQKLRGVIAVVLCCVEYSFIKIYDFEMTKGNSWYLQW